MRNSWKSCLPDLTERTAKQEQRFIFDEIGASMEELFELAKFDSYKEDNRREVKKQKADFQIVYGIPILLLPTAMAESSFLV